MYFALLKICVADSAALESELGIQPEMWPPWSLHSEIFKSTVEGEVEVEEETSPFSVIECWILHHPRFVSATSGSTFPLFTLEIPAIYTKDLCNALEIMLTSLTALAVSGIPYASLWVFSDF